MNTRLLWNLRFGGTCLTSIILELFVAWLCRNESDITYILAVLPVAVIFILIGYRIIDRTPDEVFHE